MSLNGPCFQPLIHGSSKVSQLDRIPTLFLKHNVYSTLYISINHSAIGDGAVRASLPPSPKTQTVSEPVNMAVAMGAVTQLPESSPFELKPMSAPSQLCQSVTPTMVGDSSNAEMSRSSQKPPSELSYAGL